MPFLEAYFHVSFGSKRFCFTHLRTQVGQIKTCFVLFRLPKRGLRGPSNMRVEIYPHGYDTAYYTDLRVASHTYDVG